ncbi:hypothetical protein LC040_14055 [Bacillus tianshenii]|nr:hypothetical protein LC040_14055 [Bacillus tianshenii]
MFINITIGLIIPWLIGVYLYRKAPIMVILIAPIGGLISFILNDWGFNYFWEVTPVYKNTSLSALPYCLGLYPILACSFIYFLQKKVINDLILMLLFTIVSTISERIAVMLGKIHYTNGWSIFFTLTFYFAGFLTTFIYYRILVNRKILPK